MRWLTPSSIKRRRGAILGLLLFLRFCDSVVGILGCRGKGLGRFERVAIVEFGGGGGSGDGGEVAREEREGD